MKIKRTQKNKFLHEKINLKLLSIGMGISIGITVVLFVSFAFMLTFTEFPEKYIDLTVFSTTILSILIGGGIAARKVKKNGWVCGSLIGLIYMIILYGISLIYTNSYAVESSFLWLSLVGILSGLVGGMIGINLNVKAKK